MGAWRFRLGFEARTEGCDGEAGSCNAALCISIGERSATHLDGCRHVAWGCLRRNTHEEQGADSAFVLSAST